MSEVMKVLLTGSADNLECAAKAVCTSLQSMKINALSIYSELLNDNKSLKDRFLMQIKDEEEKLNFLKNSDSDKSVLIVCGGLLDVKQKLSDSEFADILAESDETEDKIRNAYDAVFCLTSSDKCNNIDNLLLSFWTGTEHLRLVNIAHSFERLLREIKAVLGIPKPIEIERKFLIEYPDISLLTGLDTCRKIPITQAYLNTPDEGQFRIRKRGSGKDSLFIKTVKVKISDYKRIEIENYISESDYNNYLSDVKHISGIISKDRYCIMSDGYYFELDVYPFFTDRATLEIELLSENEEFTIPPFVSVIRDVSSEPEYRNFALAARFGKSNLEQKIRK